MKLKYFLLTLLMSLPCLIVNSNAQSFYSSRGFGMHYNYGDARSMSMGGTIIGIPDKYYINRLNPAGLVFVPVTRLSGDFLHEANWSKTENESGFAKYTNLNGISLAIPIVKNRIVTALSLKPVTQFDFNYETAGAIDDYGFLKKIKADGGINQISFGFGVSPYQNTYLGAYLNYNFGKLTQTWEVDYTSDLFWDTSDELSRKIWGLSYSLGFMTKPFDNLFFGAFYQPRHKITMQDYTKNSTRKGSTTYTLNETPNIEQKANFPDVFGVGISYTFKEKYQLGSDYIFEPWSNFKVEDTPIQGYDDRQRISLGFEILPSKNMLASYFRKMNYRIGTFFQKLEYLDQDGNDISEYGLTFGFGLPYYENLGRIDFAFRYGNRGNLSTNPVEEQIFQLYISVTGGEKWFVRQWY